MRPRPQARPRRACLTVEWLAMALVPIKGGDHPAVRESLEERRFGLYEEEVRADISLRRLRTYVHSGKDVFCMLFLLGLLALVFVGVIDPYTFAASQAVNALIKFLGNGQDKADEYLYRRRE